MMSSKALSYLFDHILDGFKTSHEGILNLKQQQLVSDEEIEDLIRKNSERLIDRIREFKIHEKIFGIFFACLFTWMQIDGEDLEMRRPNRGRVGRRRHESENLITF